MYLTRLVLPHHLIFSQKAASGKHILLEHKVMDLCHTTQMIRYLQ
jgi:hypothetical protein